MHRRAARHYIKKRKESKKTHTSPLGRGFSHVLSEGALIQIFLKTSYISQVQIEKYFLETERTGGCAPTKGANAETNAPAIFIWYNALC